MGQVNKMDDLISRQAAIDCVTVGAKPTTIRGRIAELPSAQPEITRCKDCEHWTNDDCPFAWGKIEDAFCSYAERRTDETD